MHTSIKVVECTNLKSYEHYVNYLFKNKDGVYNICKTEEDVRMSANYFGNRPQNAYVLMDNPFLSSTGDVIFVECENQELNHKLFRIVSIDMKHFISLENLDTKKTIITSPSIVKSKLFLRMANNLELEKIVNTQNPDEVYEFSSNLTEVMDNLRGNDKRRYSFFDLDPKTICNHMQHNPPSHIYIPQGKGYLHVCPSCGKEQIIIPSQISF